jgi:N-formylmaleamate deformylase
MTSRYLGGFHVRANGIRQHVLRYGGQGRPLLLVPGITSPAITWGFVAEELAQSHDVHVLDVRGRGLSESGSGLDYGLDACARDLIALAEALGWDKADILGHSMGARHAIRACRIDGSRFGRVVLVDPPVSGPGRRAYPARLPWYIDSMALARQGRASKHCGRSPRPGPTSRSPCGRNGCTRAIRRRSSPRSSASTRMTSTATCPR